MHEWSQLSSDEVAALDRNLPVILPIGLVEAHGPHLATSVDMDTAAYFARRTAENTGAILLPMLPYGFADEMAEYVGTLGVRAETMSRIIDDLSCRLCSHGFKRQIFLSGHGANKLPTEMAFYRIWETYPDLQAVYWNYWTEAGLTNISHADKGETEIALAVGTKSHMDRVKDFKVKKPWYRIRSRAEICPGTGGINGSPSEAVFSEGERMREDIVRILTEKVSAIIRSAE
ncbi:Creatinine amidohydrolase [Planctomycetes bacterium CA13]|uniref:Creatinine amidohydrolase n=1 Tax=Novipirellula herctigrandis TaxID=2527986 RepID=A0A5C5ZAV8_9BACT|nr:Creatinine amidohydrolase [Planctomycetes bacterium CA13]